MATGRLLPLKMEDISEIKCDLEDDHRTGT